MDGTWTAEEVVALREALGSTQEALAAALGVSVCTVSRWENGVVRVSHLAALALSRLQQRTQHAQSQKA